MRDQTYDTKQARFCISLALVLGRGLIALGAQAGLRFAVYGKCSNCLVGVVWINWDYGPSKPVNLQLPASLHACGGSSGYWYHSVCLVGLDGIDAFSVFPVGCRTQLCGCC